ncbi:MAG TPA: dienelactone hydrolase family protein [Mariprofundaceae bacterium]|nr:dienelactone hydrolase family protein [Mariprofundaceae bacterium]
MGEWISLTAADGHQLAAWREMPASAPKGGLVLVQEAFGVNHHMRDVAGRFAALGYEVVAPAMFDRYERGFEVGYGQDEIARGLAMLPGMDWDKALLDVEAARTALSVFLADTLDHTRRHIGIVGYCFGGSMAWLAACRSPFAAAVCYYGSRIPAFSDRAPRCPLIAHFGRQDKSIPVEKVEALAKDYPDIPVYLYDAGHGFACDERGSFDQAAHELAWQRTVDFLQASLG